MTQSRISNPLDRFLDEADAPDRTLAVVDRGQPDPVYELFVETFGDLEIDLRRTDGWGDGESTVVLLEDGEIVAASPMDALRDAVLLVNSDLYTTGTGGVDKYEAPSVLRALDDAVYTFRGFPASAKEKLILIVMSRYIERHALEIGEGRLDVAFQKLSRMDDEYGTKRIYERLSDVGVDLHVYGVPDVSPPDRDGMTVHTGRTERYRRTWFVVYDPPAGAEPVALVSVETERNTWRGMWTYNDERVGAIRDRVTEAF